MHNLPRSYLFANQDSVAQTLERGECATKCYSAYAFLLNTSTPSMQLHVLPVLLQLSCTPPLASKLPPRLHGPPPLLLGLAPVRPPALDLLVPAQTRTQADVDPGRCAEAEALGDLDEVQFVHVENRSQAVGGVRLQVGAVAVLGRFVEVVVFGYEGFEL
jgi:hypothetical protein